MADSVESGPRQLVALRLLSEFKRIRDDGGSAVRLMTQTRAASVCRQRRVTFNVSQGILAGLRTQDGATNFIGEALQFSDALVTLDIVLLSLVSQRHQR
ncbi:unnamed protein product [Mesocestoides corti]|uniref:ATP-binding protein n=1 Tax=Mesocestoides corti TaxID=53468 RepID=A0A0R3UIG4_MESCO|nr:unnamed protein product [Mesocestoides corti]